MATAAASAPRSDGSQRAHEAPESPGVYRFQDGRGTVLYVGKARNLRRRVLSYFGRSDLPERTRVMVERARRLDFTVTASEVEAFILENTLIKEHRPRYNVMLRDDKSYLVLRLDPRAHQGGEHRRGSGNGDDLVPRFVHRADEARPGVRDERGTGVADQRQQRNDRQHHDNSDVLRQKNREACLPPVAFQ